MVVDLEEQLAILGQVGHPQLNVLSERRAVCPVQLLLAQLPGLAAEKPGRSSVQLPNRDVFLPAAPCAHRFVAEDFMHMLVVYVGWIQFVANLFAAISGSVQSWWVLN